MCLADVLDVADLFVVGIALDVTGAYLLARSLLVSGGIAALRSGSYWGGNPHTAVAAAEDSVDASFGLSALAVGFGLQAVGYVLDLAFDLQTDNSAARAGVAIGLALLVAAIAVVVWRRTREQRIRRWLVELARFKVESAVEAAQRVEHPYVMKLWMYGRAWGFPPLADETHEKYALRVFGATRTTPGPDL